MPTVKRRIQRNRRRSPLFLALPGLLCALVLPACAGTTTSLVPTVTPIASGAATSTASPVISLTPSPTGSSSGAIWDTVPYSASPPGPCDTGPGHWFYFNNGTKGSYFCRGDGIQLTVLSTVTFTGVTGALPPAMRITVDVASMTGAAQASLVLILNGGPSGGHTYDFDCADDGTWHVRRYNPQTILASGAVAAIGSATLSASSSGQVRTFTINGAVVASINDGLTFTAASSSGFSLGGGPGDSTVFRHFVFTPL
jgi:hypothetical protein